MSSLEIPSTDPDRGNRIEQVVAREMNRSKRLLWFYSLLLVIPLGACAAYYQYGRTDVALVHSEVNNNIAPIKQIIEQTKPALAQVRQTADQLSAQQRLLESLSRKQEDLVTTVQAVPDKLQQIDSIRTDLSAVRANMQEVQARFSAVSQQQNQIERNLKDLSIRVEKTRPLSNDDQLRRQQELINSLMGRIQKLEQLQRVNPRTERPQ